MNTGTIAAVRDAIIVELQRQAETVYFWDEADQELLHGGTPEMSEFQGGILLADRFDMDAVARAAITAMG